MIKMGNPEMAGIEAAGGMSIGKGVDLRQHLLGTGPVMLTAFTQNGFPHVFDQRTDPVFRTEIDHRTQVFRALPETFLRIEGFADIFIPVQDQELGTENGSSLNRPRGGVKDFFLDARTAVTEIGKVAVDDLHPPCIKNGTVPFGKLKPIVVSDRGEIIEKPETGIITKVERFLERTSFRRIPADHDESQIDALFHFSVDPSLQNSFRVSIRQSQNNRAD